MFQDVNSPVLILDERGELTEIFNFQTCLWFTKVLEAFIKPLEAPQTSVKIKN